MPNPDYLVQEDGTSHFVLETGAGNIILEQQPQWQFNIPDDSLAYQINRDWRAFQYYDEETQRTLPPPPPVVQLPDDNYKFDATWRAFQYDEYETQEEAPIVTPPFADQARFTLAEDEITVGDVMDFGFATAPSVFPDLDSDHLWRDWRAYQYDDTDTASAYPIVVVTVPFLGSDEASERWSDWRANDDPTSRMDEPGELSPPPVTFQEEPIERWSDWRAFQHDDTDTPQFMNPSLLAPNADQARFTLAMETVAVWDVIDFGTPTSPTTLEPDDLSQRDTTWRAFQYEDTETASAYLPLVPRSIIDEISERWTDWRQVWHDDTETQSAATPLPPWSDPPRFTLASDGVAAWNVADFGLGSPPTVVTEDELYIRPFVELRWQPGDEEYTYPPVVVVVPNVGLDDSEQFRMFEKPVSYQEEDVLFPPRPPVVFQEEPIERWSAWQQVFHDDTETQSVRAPVPPYAIQDAEESLNRDWRSWLHEDVETQRAQAPIPPTVFQEEPIERWSAWPQLFYEDTETQSAATPLPPNAEQGKFTLVVSGTKVGDVIDFGFATAPTVEETELYQTKYVDWRQPYQDDLETQRTYPPTPPEVEPETADDIEALAQISGMWRAWQPEDIEPVTPKPPYAIDQDADPAKYVGWSAPAIEDDWTTTAPAPPVVFQEEPIDKWAGWFAIAVSGPEEEVIYPPPPPTADQGRFAIAPGRVTVGGPMDFGIGPPPTVVTEDELYIRPFVELRWQHDDDASAYPIVISAVPLQGFDEISDRWADWRAVYLPQVEEEWVTPNLSLQSLVTAQLVSDNGGRADENPLSDGGNWSTPAGFSAMQLVGGVFEPTSTTSGAYWSGLVWSADQYARATLLALASGAKFYLWVRYSPAFLGGYGIKVTGPLGGSSSVSVGAQGSFTTVIQAGDVWDVQIVGTQLSIYQNGILMLTAASSNIPYGPPAFSAQPNGVNANVQISNWSAGSAGFVASADQAFPEEVYERWSDWRQVWHDDTETQSAATPLPPWSDPPRFTLASDGVAAWNVADFGLGSPPTVVTEDELYIRPFVELRWQPGDEEYTYPPTPPEPETADDQELLQVAGLWRAMQPDDDQAYVPFVPRAIDQDTENARWSAWAALIVEDDWTMYAPPPPFVQQEEFAEQKNIDWLARQPDDESLRNFVPTPPFAIDQDAEHAKWVAWSAPAIEDDWRALPPVPPEVEPQTADDPEFPATDMWRAWQPEDIEPVTPKPPYAIDQDAEQSKWVAWFAVYDHIADTDEPGQIGAPAVAIQEEHAEQKNVDWRFVQYLDEETQLEFPPAPPTVYEPEEASKFDATWRAFQPEDVDYQYPPPAPPVIVTGYIDDEFHAKAFDIILKYHEDDWATYPPPPPQTLPDLDSDQKYVGWQAIQYDDTETQRTYPPTPPEVEPETADDIEALAQISGMWRALQPEDFDPAFVPNPPTVQVDEISERFVDWRQVWSDESETLSAAAPRPPFSIQEEHAEQRNIDWRAVYDHISDTDEPGQLGAPAFAIQDEISERWADWRQPYQDDLETQRAYPPTPPEVEPETADDIEALAQISGFWRAIQPEDTDTPHVSAPPFAIDQDAEHAKWAGWTIPIIEDDWATYPPFPPAAIQEEHTEQKNVDWRFVQYLDEETQRNLSPTPPTVQPDETSEMYRDWHSFQPEDVDNTKIPPAPPVIVTGYIDDEFHAKAFDTILKYYEDDWRALPPTPPTTFEPDEVSKFDATWRAFQYEDTESQRVLPPTPPTTFQEEPIEKYAGWQAIQYEDTETQRTFPPTPPFVEQDEISERWAGWQQVFQDDAETQRALPPTPPTVQTDEISERFYDWKALQPEDTDNTKTPPPPVTAANIGIDDLEHWFKDFERPISYDDIESLNAAAPTPPTVFQEEPIEQYVDWRQVWHEDVETQSVRAPVPPIAQVPDDLSKFDATWRAFQYEDTDTQRALPPTPPTTFQEEPIERTFDWRVPQQLDEETQRELTPTPPEAIDPDMDPAQYVAWHAPAIEDDWATEAPPPPPTQIDEISERFSDWRAFQYDDTETQSTPAPTPPFAIPDLDSDQTWAGWTALQPEDVDNPKTPPPPLVPFIGYDDYDLWFKPVDQRTVYVEDDWTTLVIVAGAMAILGAEVIPAVGILSAAATFAIAFLGAKVIAVVGATEAQATPEAAITDADATPGLGITGGGTMPGGSSPSGAN